MPTGKKVKGKAKKDKDKAEALLEPEERLPETNPLESNQASPLATVDPKGPLTPPLAGATPAPAAYQSPHLARVTDSQEGQEVLKQTFDKDFVAKFRKARTDKGLAFPPTQQAQLNADQKRMVALIHIMRGRRQQDGAMVGFRRLDKEETVEFRMLRDKLRKWRKDGDDWLNDPSKPLPIYGGAAAPDLTAPSTGAPAPQRVITSPGGPAPGSGPAMVLDAAVKLKQVEADAKQNAVSGGGGGGARVGARMTYQHDANAGRRPALAQQVSGAKRLEGQPMAQQQFVKNNQQILNRVAGGTYGPSVKAELDPSGNPLKITVGSQLLTRSMPPAGGKSKVNITNPPSDEMINIMLDTNRDIAPLTMKNRCEDVITLLKIQESALMQGVAVNFHPADQELLSKIPQYQHMQIIAGDPKLREEFGALNRELASPIPADLIEKINQKNQQIELEGPGPETDPKPKKLGM
jgi:hypothetical protein